MIGTPKRLLQKDRMPFKTVQTSERSGQASLAFGLSSCNPEMSVGFPFWRLLHFEPIFESPAGFYPFLKAFVKGAYPFC